MATTYDRTYDLEWHANELELYAENTYELYANRQKYERQSIDLLRHNGDTPETRQRMQAFFRAWMRHAAAMYREEIAHKRFTKEAIRIAADSMVSSTIAEWKLGNYDHMSYGHATVKPNPRGMDTYQCRECAADLPQPLTCEAVDTGMCHQCATMED